MFDIERCSIDTIIIIIVIEMPLFPEHLRAYYESKAKEGHLCCCHRNLLALTTAAHVATEAVFVATEASSDSGMHSSSLSPSASLPRLHSSLPGDAVPAIEYSALPDFSAETAGATAAHGDDAAAKLSAAGESSVESADTGRGVTPSGVSMLDPLPLEMLSSEEDLVESSLFFGLDEDDS